MRLASMEAEDRKRTFAEDDDMETSEAATGNRGREPADAAAYSEDSLRNQGTRCRVGDLHLDVVAEKAVVGGRAGRRSSY